MATKVLVLGGSGMLGAMVTDFLSREPLLRLSATVRGADLKRKCEQTLPSVSWLVLDVDRLDVSDIERAIANQEWVVNAIGVTKPYIRDDKAAEVERAIRVNALFPHLLGRAAEKTGVRVLQIATDCVYSGRKGRYLETDEHDPLDAYGKTKSLGEVTSDRVSHLRCSIIGPEPKAHLSLLDWFLRQPPGAMVKGFTNHRWNGVTTLHYARLCYGIITHNITVPHLQHIIPNGDITKCDLLRCFASGYERPDMTVTPTEAPVIIDRTLATENDTFNQRLWAAAGYARPPSVPQMVEEMAAYRRQLQEF
jgi:dTDP-4-dehydrorhamnose reductase